MELLESLELIGPGRWLDRPVLDQWLRLEVPERQRLGSQAISCRSALLRLLVAAGLEPDAGRYTSPDRNETDPVLLAGQWYGETGILLQRWSGHRVHWSSAHAGQGDGIARVIIEFEELSVGNRAADLARELVTTALRENPPAAPDESLASRLTSFRDAAKQLVLPLDAEVLIAAAVARGIPAFKLDRDPYEPKKGDFRLRDNGLLCFGHACHQQIVDGTFCLDRSAAVLAHMKSPAFKRQLLRNAGITAPLADRQAESVVAGQQFRILCAGQQFHAVVDGAGRDVTDWCDGTVLEAAARIAQQLPVGLLALNFVTQDISRPLETAGGTIIGIDVCPKLDEIFHPGDELYEALADDFIAWMFPEGRPSRIPLLSVTGTNGKTTTCRMLDSISRQAGYRVGLACTDGVYLDGKLVEAGDHSGRNGHYRVLESRDISFAVLETARGAVLNSGFAFDHSDVAICTNVTPEHLGEYGIETTEQMGDVKRMIVARARVAAVLNFDDVQCRRMAGGLDVPRLCWCSMQAGADVMQSAEVRGQRLVYLDARDGVDWIVSRGDGRTTDLMPVAEIPALFGGAARHNVMNAMQAMAAALEMGIELPAVRKAMAAFSMSIDNTPGRLNLHEGLGFPVLLDFVQNLDGMRAMCEFADSIPASGKRILVISVLGRHKDETVREFARYAAASFDRFICRNYGKTFEHRGKDEIPNLLRDGLMREGVDESCISIILDERPAIEAALAMGRPGDLVVIMCGIRPQENWQQISDFGDVLNISPRPLTAGDLPCSFTPSSKGPGR